MSDEAKWLFFDGDCTLWDVEILYDEQRAAFCSYLHHETGIAADIIEATQRKTDKELYSKLLYSPTRFPTSFVETTKKLAPELARNNKAAIEHIYNLGAQVFERTAPVANDVGNVLAAASQKYNLAMVTSGDTKVQLKRLSDFEFSDLFNEICIIPSKSEQVFTDFAQRVKAIPKETHVIGDSLRSDINPAHAGGFKTVWLTAHNWNIIEVKGHDIPDKTLVIQSLAELVKPLGLTKYFNQKTKAQTPKQQNIQLPPPKPEL